MNNDREQYVAIDDFRSLYDRMEEYVSRRNPDSYNARRIDLEVQYFKIPNLLKVLPIDYPYISIAEIGCGTGEIIGTFPGEKVTRRVGFDISPLNIDCARERFPAVEFHALDFPPLEETFDLLILSDILEHVPDRVGFLINAAKIAKLMLINVPLEKCLLYRSRKYGPEDPSGHLVAFSIEDAFRMLREADLNIMKWVRVWTMESRYERLRQELNREMTGKSFSGSPLVQVAKRIVYVLSTNIKPVGRLVFPSNLFLSTMKNGFT